jgi:hypothetical protein
LTQLTGEIGTPALMATSPVSATVGVQGTSAGAANVEKQSEAVVIAFKHKVRVHLMDFIASDGHLRCRGTEGLRGT